MVVFLVILVLVILAKTSDLRLCLSLLTVAAPAFVCHFFGAVITFFACDAGAVGACSDACG